MAREAVGERSMSEQQQPASRHLSISGVRIHLSELRFVLVVTAVILLLTTAPYIYAYVTSPADRQFMGIMLDVPDTAQYFSWMRGSIEGFLIPNRMTPEPNPAIFFNLLWWALGRLSALFNAGLAQVFQGFRILAGALYMVAVYTFCALLLESPRQRRVAFLLIILSSGFGWVLVVGKYLTGTLHFPQDVYIPEPNSFLTIMAFPHFVISVFLMLVIFYLFIVGQRHGRLRYAALAGLAGLILGLEHAYDLLIVYAVLAAYITLVAIRDRAVPWRQVKSWTLIVLLSCGPALYFAYLTSTDPLWSQVLDQFVNAGVFTPNPFHLIILLGLTFLVAVLTFDGLAPLRERGDIELFLKAWFLTGFLLIYLPVEYQIHFLSGWQIPICALATIGLFRYVAPAVGESRLLARVWDRIGLRRCSPGVRSGTLQALLAAGLILVALPTNVYLLAWRFVDLGRHGYPYYLHRDEIAALGWLDENTTADEVVLSSLTLGQYVPSLAGNTAFLAHWAQTLSFYNKQERVAQFFDRGASEEARLDTLCTFGVDYVLHGPAERELGDYDPAGTAWLTRAFSSPQVAVYQVDERACREWSESAP